jgi:arylsulfatase A-like enzyme
LTADHGEAFGEHRESGHGRSVYGEEIRVPLVLFQPGRLAPRVVEEPVRLLDVMPTLLDYCGIPYVPGSLQGRSLLAPAGARPRVFAARYVYPQHPERPEFRSTEHYAILESRWKLVVVEEGKPSGPKLEVFDLSEDPLETQNLSRSETEVTQGLYQHLREFLREQENERRAFLDQHGRGSQPGPGFGGGAAPASQDLLDQLSTLGYIR